MMLKVRAGFPVMIAARPRPRFRFGPLLVRMWRLNALCLLIFPLPVRFMRFAAPRWDFIFGIVFLFRLRVLLRLRGRIRHSRRHWRGYGCRRGRWGSGFRLLRRFRWSLLQGRQNRG